MTEEEALFWSQAITREQILPGSDLACVAGAKRGGGGGGEGEGEKHERGEREGSAC